jgi:hypothetical protein
LITIGNKSRGDEGIYVGRPSPLGNPFEIGTHGTRSEVIQKYEEYFVNRLETDESFKSEFLKLVDRAEKENICLVCWCCPQRCHAEIIRKYIDIELNKRKMVSIFKKK